MNKQSFTKENSRDAKKAKMQAMSRIQSKHNRYRMQNMLLQYLNDDDEDIDSEDSYNFAY